MNRRTLLAAVMVAAIGAAAPALAIGSADELVAQLRDQGYTDIDVSRTLLGRIRIEARSARQTREIIFNPRTGEILRDYWETVSSNSGGDSGGSIIDPSDDDDNSGSGSSGSSDDDDDGSSGSGSSGSGSGSSGSGSSGSGSSGSGSSGSGSGSSSDDDDDDTDD